METKYPVPEKTDSELRTNQPGTIFPLKEIYEILFKSFEYPFDVLYKGFQFIPINFKSVRMPKEMPKTQIRF